MESPRILLELRAITNQLFLLNGLVIDSIEDDALRTGYEEAQLDNRAFLDDLRKQMDDALKGEGDDGEDGGETGSDSEGSESDNRPAPSNS